MCNLLEKLISFDKTISKFRSFEDIFREVNPTPTSFGR